MTENKKTEASFDSIKQLSSLIGGENELVALSKNIAKSRKAVDSILKTLKDMERQRNEEIRQEKERVRLEQERERQELEKVEQAKSQPDVQESVEQEIVQEVAEEAKSTEPENKEPTEQAPQPAQPVVKIYQPPQKQEVKTYVRPQTERREYRPQTGGQGQQRPYSQGQQRPYQQGQGQQRPYQQGQKPNFVKPAGKPIVAPNVVNKPTVNKKKDTQVKSRVDEKKSMNKRTLIRKGFITEEFGEERMGTRKLKNKKQVKIIAPAPIKIEKAIISTENLTVKLLSEKIGKPANEIIKKLMLLGIMTTINSTVDFATMELVANELGVELELRVDKTKTEVLHEFHEETDYLQELQQRPAIVTVMGHVDHGKTSLLDYIRKSNVAVGEAGGITQHIGAYSIMAKGEKITFIDTPGHEAFTEMRARGAKVTDIAVLVVAADDGVMPQTIEAINHAKAAEVPMIVAVNKMDKPGANPEKILQQLSTHGVVAEIWGGDTMVAEVSAKTGQGIDKLLECILLQAEVMELRANPEKKAKGAIIEARLDKGKGPLATVIVQNGTMRVGDVVVSGIAYGRIRAMQDDKGRDIKEALPATAVAIIGLSDVPNAGDLVYVVEDEKLARQVAEERSDKLKSQQQATLKSSTLDEVYNKISQDNLKNLNVIVKADTQGTVEALKASLQKLTNEEVRISTIHGGVGAINRSDVLLAETAGATIIGFNVRADNDTRQFAESSKIDIKLYRIIYEAIEDIERMMKGMKEPKYREQIIGHAEVRNVFKITGSGVIAGLYVQDGKMQRGARVRITREGEQVFDGTISTLKRFKDDVREVGSNYECGLGIDNFDGFKELDRLEAYLLERILD